MVRNIIIEELKGKSIEQHKTELVEHKGLGHPDTICDAVCEAASKELSRYYIKEFGHIFHHNVDKGLLVAGKSNPKFNGGDILDPIHITIAGRATKKIENKIVPVDEIIINAAKNYIHNNLTALEKDHVKIDVEVKEGSGDLQDLFKRAKEMPLANDTSFGVGHAPLSRLEKTVLKVSKILTSKKFKKKFPSIGDDIKVMGLRNDNKIKLIIAIAFVDKYVSSVKEYFLLKDKIKKSLSKQIKVDSIDINSSDDLNAKNEADVYLTVTGLSAEIGDDGQVGRGNRVNSLITPNREMSLEAACGKNPVSHVGKIYNVLANLIAQDIYKKLKIKEVYVKILSEIGKPIDKPLVAYIEVLENLNEAKKEKIRKITDSWLKNVKKVTKLIIDGKVNLF